MRLFSTFRRRGRTGPRASPSGSEGCRRAACRRAARGSAGQPDIGAALGAMTVQDVGSRFARACGDVADRRDIGRRRSGGSSGLRVRPSVSSRESSASAASACAPAARASAMTPTAVPARRLAAGEVADVPEQPADRRAQHVQDFEARRHVSDSPFVNAVARRCNGHRDRLVTKSLPESEAMRARSKARA